MCLSRTFVRRLLAGTSLFGMLSATTGVAAAQTASAQAPPAAPATQAQDPKPKPQPQPEQPSQPSAPPRFLDAVTVTATFTPERVGDTPGTVSVISAEEIQRRLVANIADLVRFEPGVYVESNPARVGLNGFNIRGIGGNRVMTRIDGVESAEQFDFGPFNMHQLSMDLDTLASAEVVRSASSSLYGSDALGGVVSFFTKDPAAYLAGRRFHTGAKLQYDGRSTDTNGNVVLAGGGPKLSGSVFASFGSGSEPKNQGDIETEDATRTAMNPQDRRSSQALAKVVYTPAAGQVLRGVVEFARSRVETDVFSANGPVVLGPTVTNVSDVFAVDTLERQRYSVDHTLTDRGPLNLLSWSAFVQHADTGEVVDETRATTGAGPPLNVQRRGTTDYSQQSWGLTTQARKALSPGSSALLLTFGADYTQDAFDMIRDRHDTNIATGAPVPSSVIVPTKYFPQSTVGKTGAYLQGDWQAGRLNLVPGVRYDRFSLDADQTDQIYLDSLNPPPADSDSDAVSGKLGATFKVSNAVTLHAQYAGGFRAPPYSAINSGFTNPLAGYTSLPNPDLRPETSDNYEAGVRTTAGRVSFGVTGFWNNYDDFIEMVTVGVDPATRLLLFQNQNIAKVRIRGIELQADARLTPSVRLRASYAYIRGDDVTDETEVPLNSIAPDQGIVGLEYAPASASWGGQLTLRASAGQDQDVAGEGFYAPAAYAVADVTAWKKVSRTVTLRGGILNLTNAKYFEWPSVRGRAADTATIDRYSSPGISALLAVSYGW